MAFSAFRLPSNGHSGVLFLFVFFMYTHDILVDYTWGIGNTFFFFWISAKILLDMLFLGWPG